MVVAGKTMRREIHICDCWRTGGVYAILCSSLLLLVFRTILLTLFAILCIGDFMVLSVFMPLFPAEK